jgi:hypothetical protein
MPEKVGTLKNMPPKDKALDKSEKIRRINDNFKRTGDRYTIKAHPA